MENYKNTSLSQGLEIIRLLIQKGHSMGVTQIAQTLNLPKSSTHRLLKILESQKFVQQHKQSLLYTINPGIFGFIYQIAARFGPNSKVEPILRDAAIRLNCSVYLSMLEGPSTYVICAVGKDGGTSHLGSNSPVYASSAGKILVAQLPQAQWADYAPQENHPKLTSHTNLDKERFYSELQTACTNGFAWNLSETAEPWVSVAASIYEHTPPSLRTAVALLGKDHEFLNRDFWEQEVLLLARQISESIAFHV